MYNVDTMCSVLLKTIFLSHTTRRSKTYDCKAVCLLKNQYANN